MESAICEDSYWFVEDEDKKIKALCVICAKKQKKGWFWRGEMGYGDYDLFCSSCNNAIHLRKKNESKTSDKAN